MGRYIKAIAFNHDSHILANLLSNYIIKDFGLDKILFIQLQPF